ncbi:hypothetical protein EC968_009390 [Mortierella alpina]|nr:hypothetical protein EC968_009390 [Mortierella alpina]
MSHSQAFRLSSPLGAASRPEIYIETRYDRANNTEFIRWNDVEQVFSRVKYVLSGQVLVSFMVDDNFEDLEPKRIAYHPGVILEVVTADSEKRLTALSKTSTYEATPPSSPLPGSLPVLNHVNRLPRKAECSPASNRARDFVVFKETVGNDTRDDSDSHNDSDDEDVDEVPDLKRLPLDDNINDGKEARRETVDAKASEMWSEDDELEAEFALRYYLQYATVVDPKVLKPIFSLVESKDILTQQIASDVLMNLASIVQLNEIEVHENALSAISYISKVVDARSRLAEAGALPILARLLGDSHPISVLQILSTLLNITKVTGAREWFVHSVPRIIRTLKDLLEKNLEEDSNELLLLFLIQLVSEEIFQHEIVSVGCLVPLLRLSKLSSPHISALSATLVSRLAGPPSNDQPLIRSGWLERLIEMLDHDASIPFEDKEARYAVVSAFHRLLVREKNSKPIMDKGLAKCLCSIAMKEPPNIQLQLAGCLGSLARCGVVAFRTVAVLVESPATRALVVKSTQLRTMVLRVIKTLKADEDEQQARPPGSAMNQSLEEMTQRRFQALRLATPEGVTPMSDIHIEPRYDQKTKQHVVLWKDIQRVAADAKYILDGEKVVSFMVDDNFNE